MRKQTALGIAAAAVVALTTACDSSSTSPDTALDASESEFIALQADEILDAIVSDYVSGFGDDIVSASEGVALTAAAEPIVTTFTFERTRPCVAGGQVIANGTGEHSWDRDAQTRETNASGAKDIDNCARVRGDLTITMDGSGTFDFHRLRVAGDFSGLQTMDQVGAFTATVSDGRTEECSYELHRVLDPDAGTITVTGEVCGHVIDRVRDLNS
jgi:hypothetical protein